MFIRYHFRLRQTESQKKSLCLLREKETIYSHYKSVSTQSFDLPHASPDSEGRSGRHGDV